MPKATKVQAPGAAAIQFDKRPSKRKLQEWRQGYLFLLPGRHFIVVSDGFFQADYRFQSMNTLSFMP